MKIKSNKVLFLLFVSELLSLISFYILTDRNDYFWIGIVIVAILIILTSYFLFKNFSEFISLYIENNKKLNAARDEHQNILFSEIIEKIDNNKEFVSKKILELIQSENSMIQNNDEYCKKLSASVNTLSDKNSNLISELTKQIKVFSDNVDENVKKFSIDSQKQLSDIAEMFSKQNKEISNNNTIILTDIRMELNSQISSFIEEIKQYIINSESINTKNQNSIELISDFQRKSIEANNDIFKNISNNIEEIKTINKCQTDDLYRLFLEQIKSITNQNSFEISKMCQEINNGITVLTQNNESLFEAFLQNHKIQIDELTHITNQIMSESKKTVGEVLKTVENQLNRRNDENSSVINNNVELTKKLIAQIIENTQITLNQHLDKLETLYAELNNKTIDYTQELLNKLQVISGENIIKISDKSKEVLESIACQIEKENERTTEKRTEAFEKYISNLENTYNSIISQHIEALEEQILRSINTFTTENKEAIENNNELAKELIESEKSFVLNTEKNNQDLHAVIINAFDEYSKSIKNNIYDMKNVLTENINANIEITQNTINDLTVNNEKTIDSLADKLKEHSDTLVEKSAVAIANVQADNNAKLEKLCDEVTLYVTENKKFPEYCKDLNNMLLEKIMHLIEDRDNFIKDLKTVSDKHVSVIDSAIQIRINDMVTKLENLNIENAAVFSDSMTEYRQKFVEASAEAISEVQSDNVKSVTDANEKVAELATNMKKFQEQIVEIVDTFQSIINDGIQEKRDYDEEFDSNMIEMFDSKLSDYDSKIQEYNDSFAKLGEKITEVMNACKINTEKYDETLNFIIETQKEANSLSSKDLELLEKLAKR